MCNMNSPSNVRAAWTQTMHCMHILISFAGTHYTHRYIKIWRTKALDDLETLPNVVYVNVHHSLEWSAIFIDYLENARNVHSTEDGIYSTREFFPSLKVYQWLQMNEKLHVGKSPRHSPLPLCDSQCVWLTTYISLSPWVFAQALGYIYAQSWV